MNPFGIQQSPASFQLAKELVSTVANSEFGELREDMTENIIMKSVYGDGFRGNGDARAVLLTSTLHLVLMALEEIADEVARDAALVEAAKNLVNHPDFENFVARAEADEPKPLRRLAIVDERFREMEP